MISFPNAKINLGLQITDRRADGFHNLLSCFVPVGWADVLEIIPDPGAGPGQVTFGSSGIPIPGDADTNLCVKAYYALRADFDLPPVQMHLYKLIPIGAGLGGGSADAAFALLLLNDQFALGLSDDQLEAYARPLGSDCAFFVRNRPVYCIEKGDVFEEIELDLAGRHIVLIYPNLAISTREAYAGVRPRHPDVPLRTLLAAPIADWPRTVHNDFEDSLFPRYPLLAGLKRRLYDLGADYAAMTGSGSTVYGIFAEQPNLAGEFSSYAVWEGTIR